MKKRHQYHAYLLRFWQENNADSDMPIWRFSLEEVKDNQRYGFADLQAMFNFLQQITQVDNDSDTARDFVKTNGCQGDDTDCVDHHE